MKNKRNTYIISGLVVLVLFAVLLNSSRFFTRFDATSTRAYTISKVSRNLFSEIPDQVRITYYLSEKLKSYSPIPGQIGDILNEYSAYSRGRIQVRYVDPVKSGQSSVAEGLGIAPQQIQLYEKSEQTVATVYSGIVIEYLDRYEVIPVIFSTSNLEYELTSNIRKAVNGAAHTVGILIGDDRRSFSEDYTGLVSRLAAGFSTVNVTPGEEIPASIEVLYVIGGRDLDEFDLFYIDAFIHRGGKILFAVPGVDIDLDRNLEASLPGDAPIYDFMKYYGVSVAHSIVLDDASKNFRVPRQAFGQTVWQIVGKYPEWVAVLDAGVSKKNPITARFSGIDLLWPSPVEAVDNSGFTAEVLLASTPKSWLMSDEFDTNPNNAAMFAYRAGTQQRQSHPLALALTGSTTSYFSGRDLPVRDGATPVLAEVDGKKSDVSGPGKETRILAFGEAHFLSDLVQYSDSLYNMYFAENMTQWLTSDDDILGIKTRLVQDMRLNRIQDPKARQSAEMLAEFTNLIFIPLLLGAFGMYRNVRRRFKRNAVEGKSA